MSEEKDFYMEDEPKRGNRIGPLITLALICVALIVLGGYFFWVKMAKDSLNKSLETDSVTIVADLINSESDSIDSFDPTNQIESIDTLAAFDGENQAPTSQKEIELPKPESVKSKPSRGNLPDKPEEAALSGHSSTGEYWYARLNSFRGLYYAKKQISQAKAKGYSALFRIVEGQNEDNFGKWYEVYTGPFATQDEAARAAEAIQSGFSKNSKQLIKRTQPY